MVLKVQTKYNIKEDIIHISINKRIICDFLKELIMNMRHEIKLFVNKQW